VVPPSGTFLAKVRDGAIQLPGPLKQFCEASDWTLFRVAVRDKNLLEIQPVLPDHDSDVTDSLHSSLSPDGRLWIPVHLRTLVGLGEQSVLMRVENGAISVYLRKVFETLGFGP
jgi:hypothetical protein